jgi:hypothetical protein
MRQETATIMRAFIRGIHKNAARTTTTGESVFLHRNRIAWRDEHRNYCLTLAGWGTTTTRERLNGLCELLIGCRPFNQRKHEQYFDDMEIGESEIIVITPEVIANYRGWDAVKVITGSHILMRDINATKEAA